jgi:hypothetical protein
MAYSLSLMQASSRPSAVQARSIADAPSISDPLRVVDQPLSQAQAVLTLRILPGDVPVNWHQRIGKRRRLADAINWLPVRRKGLIP